MKKQLVLFVFSIVFCCSARAQTVVFSEDFDGTQVMTSAGMPGFSTDSVYLSSAPLSSRGQFGVSGIVTLTSPAFSTSGQNFVRLEFDQICKISFFDAAYIDLSTDSGATWIQLTGSNSVYLGSSPVFSSLGSFNAACYSDWEFSNPLSINNSWWKHEVFDISTIAASQSNLMIRFRCIDNNASGMDMYYGWLLDNISVTAAPCELFDPAVQMNLPYPSGVTFGGGPWNISVSASDVNSGIDTAASILVYSIANNGTVGADTIPLSFTGGTLNAAQLSASLPLLAEGDTVCYQVFVYDLCGNSASSNLICANINFGISLPFDDNFDSGNAGWSDTTVNGSSWQLGTPSFGQTTGAYTAPNAWDVNLSSAYQSNTTCMLYSPVFDFTSVYGAKLSFMHNYDMENQWDGCRIDVSLNGGLTWAPLGSPGDPLSVGWYNNISVNSSMLPGWTGASPGWTRAEYPMSDFNNMPDVRLRYVFTSDGIIENDGYSLDNFSIILPPAIDLSLDSIILPAQAVAGDSTALNAHIQNKGQQTITSFTLDIYINGVLDTTVQVTGSLPSGSISTTTISVFVPSDSMQVCGIISLAGDTVLSNNDACNMTTVLESQLIPYSNNFEISSEGWIGQNGSAAATWQLGTPAYGVTTGAYSGVTCWDINLSTPYGNPSGPQLISPVFDVSDADTIRVGFYHNFLTMPGRDGVELEYETDLSGIYMKAGYRDDPAAVNWYNDTVLTFPQRAQFAGNSLGWLHSFIDIPAASVGKIRFRFTFRSLAGAAPNADGYSLDDFYIIEKPEYDVAVSAINGIRKTAGISSSPVITIKNTGLQAVSSVPVHYNSTSGSSGSIIYNGTLQPGASDTVTFAPFVFPSGDFSICAMVTLSNDSCANNDTLCRPGFGVNAVPLPYFDDFEGASDWTVVTTGNAGTVWEHGMPAFGQTASTHSGASCWDINLATAYTNNAWTSLVSPYIYIAAGINDTLKFWQNYNSENGWDGVRLEYELNASDSWQILGTFGDTSATNWYTDGTLNSSLLPAWEGTSAGWIQSKIPLNFPASADLARFRFVFTSDNSQQTDGYSIDDFEVTTTLDNDLMVQSVLSPGASASAGVPVNATVTLYNSGLLPTIPFNVYYSLNGGAVTTIPVALPMPSHTVLNVQLGSVVPITGQNHLRIYTDMGNDLNLWNDTLDYFFTGLLTVTPPYAQDFELNTDGWTSIPSTIGSTAWEWGTPAFGTTSSPHSGNSSWDINLNMPYGSGTYAVLESPVFNYTNIIQSQLEFWVNYNTELSEDGVQLQFSTDDINYQVLGNYNDANGTNWYNTAIMPSFLGPAWTGNSGGWQQVQYNTSSMLDGLPFVKFRFIFRSDVTLSGDGFSMDDFAATGIVGMKENAKSNVLIYPNPFSQSLYIVSDLKEALYVIYNVEGAAVSEGRISDGRSILDLSRMKDGVYFIRLNTEDEVITSKIIKGLN